MLKTLRRVKELEQYHLRALNGEFGAIEDFCFDDRAWTARYFIVNTGGWLGGRKVLISPAAITAVNEQDQVLEVGHTKEQIELSPPMEADKPVSRQYEEHAHVFSTVISTRRFCCRPCGLSLPSGFVFDATDFVSPKHARLEPRA